MDRIKEKYSKLIAQINDMPLGRLDWGLLAVMSVFIFFTMFYGDLKIIYHHSLTFLDTLFAFDLPNFYANTMENPCYGFGAVYYWIVYAVIGIWNFPVWIVTRLFSVDIYAVGCLLWSKMQIVLFFFLTLKMIEQILKEFGFGKEKYRFVQFLFASSLFVVLPVTAIAQIDIITVFFMLWGIWEYLKSEKITWKFLLIFSFAASLKIFALFVFIPLVLLKEKRILFVLFDLAAGLLCVALCLIPYAGRQDYVESTSILNDVMVERMFSTVFPAGNTDIPIFLAILVALSIFAYAVQLKRREDYFYYAMWLSLAVFGGFFVFVFAHPYWIVLLAPYLAIFIVLRGDNQKLNMILEFFISSCLSIYYCITFQVYMTQETFEHLILKKIPRAGGAYAGDFIARHELELYVPIFFMIFAVCLAAFLILNRPKKYMPFDCKKAVQRELKFDQGMIYLRLFGIFAFIVGCLYFSYFK